MESLQLSDFPYESEAGLSLISSSTLRVAFLDFEDRFLYSNRACASVAESLKVNSSASFLDLVLPQFRPAYQALKQKLHEQSHIISDCVEVKLALGESKAETFYVSLSLIRDSEKNPVYFKMLLRDSAEQQQLESRYARSDKALQNSHVLVFEINRDGVFIGASGRVADNLLISVEGKHFTEVYANNPDAQARVRRVLAGERFDVEVLHEAFWYHIWYEPIFDEVGNIVGALSTSHPIDRQKQIETKLKKEVLHQQEASRIREELLSVASHEIRSPLASLAMQFELLELRMREPDQARIREALEILYTSGRDNIEKVFSLVQNTLDVSRINELGLTLNLGVCDLASLVRKSVHRCIQRNDFKGAAHLETPDFLQLTCDSFRFEQVVENLVSNAIKFGAGKPIAVRLMNDSRFTTLEVQDQGSGMCAETQRTIFQRFMRGDEHKGIAGFGMGLYIVDQIVRAHGGSIEIESAPGQGALFRVKLPLKSNDLASTLVSR